MHFVNMGNILSDNVGGNIAGLVLAGGKSSRMGQDKADIDFNGKTLLKHMQNLLKNAGINKIYISGENAIADIVPNCGPLGGIYSALQQISEQELLIVPIDMPLLTSDILKKMLEVNCLYNNRIEAVIYEKYNLPLKLYITEQLKENIKTKIYTSDVENRKSLSISLLLKELNVKYLPISLEENKFFVNVNTPNDLEVSKQEAN